MAAPCTPSSCVPRAPHTLSGKPGAPAPLPLTRDELAAWLRLATTRGLRPAAMRALLATFGLPQHLFAQPLATLAAAVGEHAARAVLAPPARDFAQQLAVLQAWLAQPGHAVVTLADPAYPPRLLTTPDPPPLLYVAGALDWLHARAIAVVGSRSATPQGIEDAHRFARAFSDAGLVVVSGLALGIDKAAHCGALAGSAGTVAIVGTGMDIVYPPGHRALAAQIVAQGAIASEWPLGTPARPAHFPQRNRLIAGLADGVLVVEAAWRSGSLITARLANEMGRDVFALPGSIHAPLARGCHRLLREGARLVETPDEVLDELGIIATRKAHEVSRGRAAAPRSVVVSFAHTGARQPAPTSYGRAAEHAVHHAAAPDPGPDLGPAAETLREHDASPRSAGASHKRAAAPDAAITSRERAAAPEFTGTSTERASASKLSGISAECLGASKLTGTSGECAITPRSAGTSRERAAAPEFAVTSAERPGASKLAGISTERAGASKLTGTSGERAIAPRSAGTSREPVAATSPEHTTAPEPAGALCRCAATSKLALTLPECDIAPEPTVTSYAHASAPRLTAPASRERDTGAESAEIVRQRAVTAPDADPEARRETRQLLDALGHAPATFETLAQRTGMTEAALQGALLRLELSGQLCALPGGHFVRVTRG